MTGMTGMTGATGAPSTQQPLESGTGEAARLPPLSTLIAVALLHCKGGHGPALARAVHREGSIAALSSLTAVALKQHGLSDAQQTILRQAALFQPPLYQPTTCQPPLLQQTLRQTALCQEATLHQFIDSLPTEHKQRVVDDVLWAQSPGNHLLTYESEYYPGRLKETHCPPILLYVRGSLAVLASLQLAIVGSRRASDYGKRNAYWMARELCESGLSICSGMALGIDAQAHAGALDATPQRDACTADSTDIDIAPNTVAVLGTGIDRIYPARHAALYERIAKVGAVVSEFPLGTPAYAYNFPRRNRLISGLSAGVLVIEAALRSGSLITARFALEQNRDVFALPSLLSNPQGRGCHSLIKQGAMLVDEPADILSELGLAFPVKPAPPIAHSRRERVGSRGAPWREAEVKPVSVGQGFPADLAPLQRHILQRLRTEDCLFDSLIDTDAASFNTLNQALLDLEVRGLVACRGGRYSIA